MATVIITDGRYRSAIAAARELGRVGYDVIVTEARGDVQADPPVFSSRYACGAWIEGSVKDADYPDRLLAFVRRYDRPVLLPIGAATLSSVARRKAEFAAVSDFLVADPAVIDALNDKDRVHDAAEALGLRVSIGENPQDDVAAGCCVIAASDRMMTRFEQSGCLIEI